MPGLSGDEEIATAPKTPTDATPMLRRCQADARQLTPIPEAKAPPSAPPWAKHTEDGTKRWRRVRRTTLGRGYRVLPETLPEKNGSKSESNAKNLKSCCTPPPGGPRAQASPRSTPNLKLPRRSKQTSLRLLMFGTRRLLSGWHMRARGCECWAQGALFSISTCR